MHTKRELSQPKRVSRVTFSPYYGTRTSEAFYSLKSDVAAGVDGVT